MERLLEKINSPEDIKKLSGEQLKMLADQIRQYIIDTVSRNGGHLASNLGAVDMTLALHYVFDFRKDKLLWDVGHQCYAHKIITGRRDKFADLRQAEGVSGFPNPQESDYDQFRVGHAGTSIATAIGMALGQLKNEDNSKIVAVVGDASIVNGASFEALNNLDIVKRQLLIVLNDNSMAIDPTKGAMAKYFSEMRLSQTYGDMVRTSKRILEHMPVLGKGVEETIERIKKSLRMALPPSQLFESLNISYYGPVDGHDIALLIKLFGAISYLDRPAILHLFTKKGMGFGPAENDKPKYHSTGPFAVNGDIVEPTPATGKSYTNIFGEHLVKLAGDDSRITAITAAMCDGTGLGEFQDKFPQRFHDVGIAESVSVDIAAGLAKSGARPFVCIYSTFMQRCFDQIFEETGLVNLPVVFCIDRAGLVGADGPTHHGLMDTGFLRMIPNMVVIAPACATEMKLAIEFALGHNGPVCIRYPKDIVPDESEFDYTSCKGKFELGKSVAVRKSSGSKIAIVNYGGLLCEVLRAADLLIKDDIKVDIINARFASPLDGSIAGLVKAGKKLITVEDHFRECGFGSCVLEAVSAAGLPASIKVLGVPRGVIQHDSRRGQLMAAGINADGIVRSVKELI